MKPELKCQYKNKKLFVFRPCFLFVSTKLLYYHDRCANWRTCSFLTSNLGLNTRRFFASSLFFFFFSPKPKHVQSVSVHMMRCGVMCMAKSYVTSYVGTQFVLFYFYFFYIQTQLLIVGCHG